MKERFGATRPAGADVPLRRGLWRQHADRAAAAEQYRAGRVSGARLGAGRRAIGVHRGLGRAFAIPTEQTAELALRTQQVLAYETGVASVVDPLGGSYFVEALTDRVEREAARDHRANRAAGRDGPLHPERRDPAGDRDRSISPSEPVENGEQVVVGVNRFTRPEPERAQLEFYKSDPDIAARQAEKLWRIRAKRDNSLVSTRWRNCARPPAGIKT